MKNIREIAGNVAMIGGLLTAAGSAADAIANKALFREMTERSAVTESVRATYGVEEDCTLIGLFSGSPTESCIDTVPGKSEDEEKKILDQYRQELNDEQSKIPYDPRGYADLGAFVGGLMIAATGDAVKRKSGK